MFKRNGNKGVENKGPNKSPKPLKIFVNNWEL